MPLPTDPHLHPTVLAALRHVLEEEIRQYESTIGQLTLKKEVLVSGKPQRLALVDRELITLGQKAMQLEKQRQQILHDMGYPNLPLEQLIAHMAPADASLFRTLRDRLRRAAQDVERLNRENRDLLELALGWIKETVELIADVLTPEASSYDAQGGKPRRIGKAPPDTIQSTINHSA